MKATPITDEFTLDIIEECLDRLNVTIEIRDRLVFMDAGENTNLFGYVSLPKTPEGSYTISINTQLIGNPRKVEELKGAILYCLTAVLLAQSQISENNVKWDERKGWVTSEGRPYISYAMGNSDGFIRMRGMLSKEYDVDIPSSIVSKGFSSSPRVNANSKYTITCKDCGAVATDKYTGRPKNLDGTAVKDGGAVPRRCPNCGSFGLILSDVRNESLEG